MQKQSAFLNVIVRNFAGAARRFSPRPSDSPQYSPSTRGHAVAAPPAFAFAPTPPAWPHEACANEPADFLTKREWTALGVIGTRILAALLLVSISTQAAVREVGAIGLTVANLDQEVEFFTRVLQFEKVTETVSLPGAADALLNLKDTRLRSAELRLGSERITLSEHLTNKGRPNPGDSRSFDHWFQHIAIVVSDMDRAYEHLRRARVKHVSTGPQTLPAWNKDAGGIKAFYFRDPEDHVLEIIWFPPGKGDPKWQSPTQGYGASRPSSTGAGSTIDTPLFLGIDHTAIVVSDTERSLAFYTNVLGLRVVGGAENFGTEQEHLNQVFGARLRITALRADHGPGIEFLEYITPPGGRPLPPDAKSNDLIFWRTHLIVDQPGFLDEARPDLLNRRISASPSNGSVIVRDPDGHALQLDIVPGAAR